MAYVELNPFKGSAKAKFRQLCFLKAIVGRDQSFEVHPLLIFGKAC